MVCVGMMSGALASISANEGNGGFILSALEDEEVQLLAGLAELVQCTDALAQQSAEEEAAGELGYLDLVSSKPLEACDIRMLSWKIDAEALSTATKVGEMCTRALVMPSG